MDPLSNLPNVSHTVKVKGIGKTYYVIMMKIFTVTLVIMDPKHVINL